MAFAVYCHTNKENGKKYIGITSMEPKHRWLSGKGYSGNKKFCKDIEKYGWSGFEHEILFDGLSQKEAVDLERDLIQKYDTVHSGYNNSYGGRYGKSGNLSSECNRLKDALKKFPGSRDFDYFLELFNYANEASTDDTNIAERLNTYIPNIKKNLSVQFRGGWWGKEHFYDIKYMCGVLYELKYVLSLEQSLESGDCEIPKYVPFSQALEDVFLNR